METTKDYYEKIMQDYKLNGKGRSLNKYCREEGVDYQWLLKYKVKYPHDINGFVMYEKWFDDGRFLKPEFVRMEATHQISRETLILLLSTSVQTKII